jgi:hypothetical protein
MQAYKHPDEHRKQQYHCCACYCCCHRTTQFANGLLVSVKAPKLGVNVLQIFSASAKFHDARIHGTFIRNVLSKIYSLVQFRATDTQCVAAKRTYNY